MNWIDADLEGSVQFQTSLKYLTQSGYALILCVMKTFSIMETQHNLALVLREVAAGHEVGITRHKKLVARLLPPAVPAVIELPDFVARARNVWQAGWSGTSSSELLEESRGSR